MIGEAGVRLYSAGQPGGARADRLLYQANLACTSSWLEYFADGPNATFFASA